MLERIKTFAEFLKIDKTLTSLDLRFEPGEEGSKIIAEALKENHTITYLYFGHDITAKSVGTKAFFKTLKVNKTITELSLMLSRIGAEEAKALAEALKVNKTLTSFSYMNDHNTEKMLEQRQQL